jgi:hypothetical protein
MRQPHKSDYILPRMDANSSVRWGCLWRVFRCMIQPNEFGSPSLFATRKEPWVTWGSECPTAVRAHKACSEVALVEISIPKSAAVAGTLLFPNLEFRTGSETK